ncbi:MAG: DUF5063 domain-containing protein [Bacteroidaceae bacterium]
MEKKTSNIYLQNTIEFVTISTECCLYLEQLGDTPRKNFVDVMRKMLSLLYLKASLLPSVEDEEIESYVEQVVSEADYEAIRLSVYGIMGEQDDYLDVFVDDIKYSDTPIRKTISEDLADIYQSIRNFVGVYKEGYEEAMSFALVEVINQFETYWGQTLVNTLRALHDVQFNQHIEMAEDTQ